MSSENEPRRSVRATKGQHTKAFDQLENGPEPAKRRQTKKGTKKVVEKDEKQDDEDEVIRCICGATTQDDDDTNEPWIACNTCGAWQHNVCMGMSVFEEDLPKEYFCEQCAPAEHKSTLEAMKRGEKPWEDRRHKHNEEKKRKKGGRKSKGKRISDPKERASPSIANAKAKASPTPDIKHESNAAESDPVPKGKRKPRDHSQGPHGKLRKVAEAQAVPSVPEYTPPNDLPESIQKLEGPRRQAALGLQKSLDAAIDLAEKKKLYSVPEGSSKKNITERLAIEIERAFQDTHPNTSHNASQLRTLIFSLKNNVELAAQILNRTLPPTSFVVMTGDELATKEQQREAAEIKARAEKQSILITDDVPRVRRTHKGEELVEADHYGVETDDSSSNIRRQALQAATEAGNATNQPAASPANRVASPANDGGRSNSLARPLRIETQPSQSPKRSDFDIGKVFSSVRSPSLPHQRRASTQAQSTGPGDDPEVDRLLQEDGDESPPYSPSEHTDPDIVWRGPLVMTNICEVDTVAKYAGGADLSKARGIPWKDLVPPRLSVAGRINEDKAVPYLCGMRWNNQVDLIITSLAPSHPSDQDAKEQFMKIIDYFLSKKRYGVVGEKKLGNVRDTYLVPVAAGDGPIPEPVQNIDGHLIPSKRSEPMLLMIFVYRDETRERIKSGLSHHELQGSPAEPPFWADGLPDHMRPPLAARSWSDVVPSGTQAVPQPDPFAHSPHSKPPVPPPTIPGQTTPPVPLREQQEQQQQQTVSPDPTLPALQAQHLEACNKAKAILGKLYYSTTVTFLLPHAHRMKEGEWMAVRKAMERDPKAQTDLQVLSKILTEDGNNIRKNGPDTTSAGVAQAMITEHANTDWYRDFRNWKSNWESARQSESKV
ncbi:hypothetical protein F5Y05DRAFT_262393 [Hypoxylon sp. FL0543]|nr:hypothetical protein F5Y05DRAFT_262393 [Hypoxylon sp. FL0543]